MRVFISVSVFFASLVFGCTDFVVQSTDGSFVNGRSLEFGLELQSKIKVFPRNQKMVSQAPGQKSGTSWVSKYGYLGITALGMNFTFDGMNEAGLSFGYLWLPGVTQYPTVAPQELKSALDFVDFGAWALGNFSTVSEVKAALKTVRIWGHVVQPLGVPPVHAAIHDAQGGSIVVEFVGGQMKVYDNPISVLTNSPPFDWQISNLQNYLNLTPQNPDPVTFRGVQIAPPGQGSGFLGLPGDWSPPSRFVKIATFLRFAKEPANSAEGVNLAEHLLNAVDIPLGEVRDPGKETGDYTQWIVIKDLTQKVFYFRSYSDLVLKMIDMKKLNFDRENKNSLSVDMKRGYFDVTESLKGREMTVLKE
jgi:choloylglycine hydrolase